METHPTIPRTRSGGSIVLALLFSVTAINYLDRLAQNVSYGCVFMVSSVMIICVAVVIFGFIPPRPHASAD